MEPTQAGEASGGLGEGVCKPCACERLIAVRLKVSYKPMTTPSHKPMRKQISRTMGTVSPSPPQPLGAPTWSNFPNLREINATHKHHQVSSYDQLLSKGKR